MDQKRPSPTMAELAEDTIRALVPPAEIVAVAFQAITLVQSALLDPYPTVARTFIGFLALLHGAAAYLVARTGKGPLTRGGSWLGVWVTLVLLMPVVAGLLLPKGVYGNNQGGVQLFGYSTGPVALAAFYSLRRSREATVALRLFPLVVAAEFAPIIYVVNGTWTSVNTKAVFSTALWTGGAYLAGLAVRELCRLATRRLAEIQKQNYEGFFGFLHSHIGANAAAIKLELGRPEQALKCIEHLEQTISKQRLNLLLGRQQPDLAELVRYHIHTFDKTIKFYERPRVGGLTAPRAAALLISRALGDLLRNSVEVGAQGVALRIRITPTEITVDVADDGPDFDGQALVDETTSLYRLGNDIERLGGSLIKVVPGDLSGAHMRVTLPLYDTSTMRWRRHAYSSS